MEPGSDPRRVLIVTATMGGGHLQISREIARRLTEHGHDVRVVDMLAVMPRPVGAVLRWIYAVLVGRLPWLYERVYRTFFLPRQRAGERVGVPVRLAEPGLRRVVERVRPDVVATTYHLAALAVGRLRASGALAAPAVTVITQWAVNDLWLHPAVDAELCISEQAAHDATARTGRAAQVCGPIVRPAFTLAPGQGEREAARTRLGLGPATRAALVVTGSQGFAGSVHRAVAAVAARPGWVPVVVCGRNAGLRRRLARVPGAVALGWVEDMASLMAACDVLVDNAAGMSAKEALGIGLPVVTFRPLAGHGRIDAEALARLGLADVVDDEQDLAAALGRLDATGPERAARGQALFVADAAEMVLAAAASAARKVDRRGRRVEGARG